MTERDDRHEPGSIDVDRAEAVTIEFLDGEVARFELVELRQGCPCATCRALRDRGVEGMAVGGRRRLTIPPHLGYGQAGAGGAIKGGETLVFVVDLLGVS